MNSRFSFSKFVYGLGYFVFVMVFVLSASLMRAEVLVEGDVVRGKVMATAMIENERFFTRIEFFDPISRAIRMRLIKAKNARFFDCSEIAEEPKVNCTIDFDFLGQKVNHRSSRLVKTPNSASGIATFNEDNGTIELHGLAAVVLYSALRPLHEARENMKEGFDVTCEMPGSGELYDTFCRFKM